MQKPSLIWACFRHKNIRKENECTQIRQYISTAVMIISTRSFHADGTRTSAVHETKWRPKERTTSSSSFHCGKRVKKTSRFQSESLHANSSWGSFYGSLISPLTCRKQREEQDKKKTGRLGNELLSPANCLCFVFFVLHWKGIQSRYPHAVHKARKPEKHRWPLATHDKIYLAEMDGRRNNGAMEGDLWKRIM